MAKSNEIELRRLAMQIVSQLPDKRADAIRALELARELFEWVRGEHTPTA